MATDAAADTSTQACLYASLSRLLASMRVMGGHIIACARPFMHHTAVMTAGLDSDDTARLQPIVTSSPMKISRSGRILSPSTPEKN